MPCGKIGHSTTPPTESNGHSSVGAHSNNRLVRYFLLPTLLPLNLVNRHQFACLDLELSFITQNFKMIDFYAIVLYKSYCWKATCELS